MGGTILWNGKLVKAWSKTMSIIALSSGESELSAVVRGATEGMGIQAVLADYGYQCELQISSDATAAIGMVKRQGLGRVRHLAVADLWIQQSIRKKELRTRKWPGLDNPADLMTKYKCRPESQKFMNALNFNVLTGRPTVTPLRENGWTVDKPVDVARSRMRD